MNQSINNNLVLACRVPDTAAPGKSFHVKLESENRFFEVITPGELKLINNFQRVILVQITKFTYDFISS